MILPAQTIRGLCMGVQMVSPFSERTVENGMTFGLSAAGYDVRIAQSVTLAGAMVLASTMEHFNIPDDVLAVVHDKSSWARRGIAVQNTVIEPGWRGYLTLEITNHSHEIVTIPAGSPIAQIVFMRLEAPTDQPYTGKYQDQREGPQPAIRE